LSATGPTSAMVRRMRTASGDGSRGARKWWPRGPARETGTGGSCGGSGLGCGSRVPEAGATAAGGTDTWGRAAKGAGIGLRWPEARERRAREAATGSEGKGRQGRGSRRGHRGLGGRRRGYSFLLRPGLGHAGLYGRALFVRRGARGPPVPGLPTGRNAASRRPSGVSCSPPGGASGCLRGVNQPLPPCRRKCRCRPTWWSERPWCASPRTSFGRSAHFLGRKMPAFPRRRLAFPVRPLSNAATFNPDSRPVRTSKARV
jgi:hypothetical protein